MKVEIEVLKADADAALDAGDINTAIGLNAQMDAIAAASAALAAQNFFDLNRFNANERRQAEILEQIREFQEALPPYYCVDEL